MTCDKTNLSKEKECILIAEIASSLWYERMLKFYYKTEIISYLVGKATFKCSIHITSSSYRTEFNYLH